MDWSALDFAMAALLLASLAIGLFLVVTAKGPRWFRITSCFAVTGLVALIWAQGAVGLF